MTLSYLHAAVAQITCDENRFFSALALKNDEDMHYIEHVVTNYPEYRVKIEKATNRPVILILLDAAPDKERAQELVRYFIRQGNMTERSVHLPQLNRTNHNYMEDMVQSHHHNRLSKALEEYKKLFIEEMRKVTEEAFEAVRSRNFHEVEALVEKFPLLLFPHPSLFHNGQTLLHCAADNCSSYVPVSFQIFVHLMRNGADYIIKDIHGKSVEDVVDDNHQAFGVFTHEKKNRTAGKDYSDWKRKCIEVFLWSKKHKKELAAGASILGFLLWLVGSPKEEQLEDSDATAFLAHLE